MTVKPLLDFLRQNVTSTVQAKSPKQRNLTMKEKELISKFRHLLKDMTPGNLSKYSWKSKWIVLYSQIEEMKNLVMNGKELETVRIIFDRLECIRMWLVDLEEEKTVFDIEARRHPTLEGDLTGWKC